MDWQPTNRGSIPDDKKLLSFKASIPRPTEPAAQWYRNFSSGIEAGHSHFGAEVKDAWSYVCTPPCAFRGVEVN